MGRITVSLLLCFLMCFAVSATQTDLVYAGSEEKLAPEDLIARHIKSIGGDSVLSSLQSTAFTGEASVHFIQGMQGKIVNGKSTIVSQGHNLSIIMKYNDINYPGEYLSYDGKDVMVGFMRPGIKSPLGDFIFRFNGVMKKGFLGGIFSLSWPLLDIDADKAKLKYKKTKVEDRELHQLEWPINILGNIKIRMYFEPDTYHHVRTEYVVRIEEDVSVQREDVYAGEVNNQGSTDMETPYSNLMRSDIPESIYTLIEKFDDFKQVSGMTLPHKYTIDYELEGQGSSFVGQWVLQADNWIFNQVYPDKIFQAQK